MQPTVTSGNGYVVPKPGAVISWSTNAAAGSGQMLELKMFRQVSGATYSVVGHDGPRALTGGVENTFSAHIPVQAGDVLGLNSANAGSVPNACLFSALSDSYLGRNLDLADGASGFFGRY
jgi:hypothetical protein